MKLNKGSLCSRREPGFLQNHVSRESPRASWKLHEGCSCTLPKWAMGHTRLKHKRDMDLFFHALSPNLKTIINDKVVSVNFYCRAHGEMN